MLWPSLLAAQLDIRTSIISYVSTEANPSGRGARLYSGVIAPAADFDNLIKLGLFLFRRIPRGAAAIQQIADSLEKLGMSEYARLFGEPLR